MKKKKMTICALDNISILKLLIDVCVIKGSLNHRRNTECSFSNICKGTAQVLLCRWLVALITKDMKLESVLFPRSFVPAVCLL